jgi:hypothetical protein
LRRAELVGMRKDPCTRAATIVILAVVGGLAAVACSSSPAVDATDTTTSPRSAGAGDAATAPPSTEAGTFRPGTSTGTTAPRMVVAPVDKPFCDRADQAKTELNEMTDSDPQALPRFQQYLRELSALAPAEIKDSVGVLNRIAQSAPSIRELSKIRTPELDAANDKVEAWSKAHCGTTD